MSCYDFFITNHKCLTYEEIFLFIVGSIVSIDTGIRRQGDSFDNIAGEWQTGACLHHGER